MNLVQIATIHWTKAPLPVLAGLSNAWVKEKKLGCPLQNGTTLLYVYIVTVLYVLLIAFVLAHAFTNSRHCEGLVVTYGVFVMSMFTYGFLYRVDKYVYRHKDALKFMNGITDLERLTGLRYDAWTLNTDFDTPARHYLEHLAQSVVAAEVAEKKAGTIAPWDGAYAKASSRARTEFNNAHDWLTALVPSLPSGKGRYFP